MGDLMDKVGSLSKHLGEGVANLFNHDHDESRKVRIWEVANFIFDHPDTKKTTRNLLGLVFNEYRLTIGAVSMKMETKGRNDEHILELLTMENGEELFTFKSYEKGQSVKDKHELPERLWVH